MGHFLEKYYSSFGGVDSRSNKLLQDPKTMRKGSKNFRYNFQDEIQKANGFQHKTAPSPYTSYGLFEYKYTDLNSGESKTEVLGVAGDGNLYRTKKATMILTAHGAATSISIFYDEVNDTFKCELTGLGSVDISETMTLADLKTALELLPGVTVSLSGDTSTLAYLLDCVIADESFAENSAYYFELVPAPGGIVPFDTAILTSPNFSGISSTNLNNVLYITCGQELMKYDGHTVHRAGMPRVMRKDNDPSNPNGRTISGNICESVSAGSETPLTAGAYAYRFQLVNVDAKGNEIVGKCDYAVAGDVRATIGATSYTKITIPAIKNSKLFPVYAAKASADAALSSTGGTISVNSGHNIIEGMYLRLPIYLNNVTPTNEALETNYVSFYYALVTAVTNNSITIGTGINPVAPPDYSISVKQNQVLNAGFYDIDIADKIGAINYLSTSLKNNILIGSAIRVWRTKVNPSFDTSGIALQSFYKVGDFAIPQQDSDLYYIYDNKPDSGLTELFADATQGEEVPRYGKLVSSWQGQLVQAGTPVDTSVVNNDYPTFVSATNITPISKNTVSFETKITEVGICDTQSFYWADSANIEGFPTSGLNEQRVDSPYNDNITAIASNKDAFFAFKDKTTSVHTGTLSTGDIVSEVLEGNIGCCSQSSVQDVMGSLVWLDKKNGFFSCVAGRLPVNIGYPISDYQKINAEKLDYTKAVATVLRSESMYICAVGSTTFVYDYAHTDNGIRDCWYIWDRINTDGILATANDELLILNGANLWKMKRTNTKYDFTDHTSAIDMHVLTAWLSQGEPTIDKHYVSTWINSIQGGFNLDVEQYGNFLSEMISSLSVNFKEESSAKKFVKIGVKCAVPKLSSISIGFKNEEKNTFVRLQGWELEFNKDFDSGEPKR